MDNESTRRWHIKTDMPGSIDFAGKVICLRPTGASGDFAVPGAEEKKPVQSDREASEPNTSSPTRFWDERLGSTRYARSEGLLH